jgi:hypothetical protein
MDKRKDSLWSSFKMRSISGIEEGFEESIDIQA